MLNDSDKWPVTCTKCGYVSDEPIGRLKDIDELTCQVCKKVAAFDRSRFSHDVSELKRSVEIAMRNSGYTS
jgi:hypothetical protein